MTRDQERAVTLAGRDVCVVAGAGSGKTTVLAERFAHAVLSGRSQQDRRRAVDRLLTLTFTEKAATEMRERVARRFADEGNADLRRAVETAWVSTFHAFCARLLKENAVEAGVDPSFQVLAEGDASLLLEEAREETVARWGAERPEALAPLSLLASSDLEDLVAGLLAAGPAPAASFADLFAAAANPPAPAGEMEAVRAALGELARDLDRYEGAAAEAAAAAVEAGRNLEGIESVTALRSFRMPGRDRKGAVPAKPRLVALRDACDTALAVLLAVEAAPAAKALAALLDDTAAAFRARKEERGALDFADLEARAVAFLEADAEAREEARARFDAILVDEYQDTSPAQERLLAALAGPGRTFTVGDPKQAIYGFRGADVAGFARARAAAGEEGTVLLVENFRSRPEILRFSNAVLGPAFAAGGADQVRFERLEPGAAHGPKDRPSVEVHLVGGEGEGAGDLRPREAALLASRIRSLVAGGEACITRCDSPTRPLGWGDAAILLRATTDIQVYERALADADVPYQVVKGRGFFEAREVVDLANLLEALEDPAHDLALAATLRSPFAGLDDGALLALVDSLPRDGSVRAPLSTVLREGARGLSPEMRRRFVRFRETWTDLLELRRRGRLHGVLDRALRDTGYSTTVLLRPGGRQRAANLRKVLERARSFESSGLGGPGEFLRLVRRLRLREERETEAPLAAEDAVSIMTVHQAKGLEWPLVAIPDLGRRPPSPSGAVLSRGGRAGLRIRIGTEKTPLWEAIREEKIRAEDAEAVRLFHVALTRAKEHLVLSSGVKGEDGERGEGRLTGLSILQAHLPLDAEGRIRIGKGTPDEVEILLRRTAGSAAVSAPAKRFSLATLRRKRLLAGRGPGVKLKKKDKQAVEAEVDGVLALKAPAPDGTPYMATVSAVLDYGACPLRYYLGHEIGAPDRAPPSVDAEAGRAGEHDEEPSLSASTSHGVPRWISGVAAHAVLGTMDLRRDGEAEIRATALARLREDLDEDPPAEALEEVVAWVSGFLASPLGIEVRAAAGREGHLLREVPFLCREEGVLLRGQIDLVVRDADGAWTLADYKASRPPRAAEKRGRYERQLQVYALALGGVPMFKDAPPARGALVYLDPAVEVVEVSLAPAALASARGLLARFREGTRMESWKPDPRHCRACPFGPGGTRSCTIPLSNGGPPCASTPSSSSR